MSLPEAILELENRSIGAGGKPTLGEALLLAVKEWRSGNRDRELRLHLLFLAWYCIVEPPHLTGLNESRISSSELPPLFLETYETFEADILDDAEALYVVGLMAHIFPWALDKDIPTWEARSKNFRVRYRELLPDGFTPAHFEGRGAYGNYFSDQAAVDGGY